MEKGKTGRKIGRGELGRSRERRKERNKEGGRRSRERKEERRQKGGRNSWGGREGGRTEKEEEGEGRKNR